MNSANRDTETSSFRFRIAGVVVCLLLAIGLRQLVVAYESKQLTRDRDAYLGIATGIADGVGYCTPGTSSPTAFRPPLYPLILGVGSRWIPMAIMVAAVNLICGVLTVLMTADLARRFRLGSAGLLAVLLIAVDPLLLQYASRPMTESLCTCLAAFWIWSVAAFWPQSNSVSVPRAVICGIAFGLLVLSRPTFWPIAGFCALSLLVSLATLRKTASADFKRSLFSAIWTTLGTAIVVAPWVMRNTLIFGTPILTTTHGGYTLLLGNNPVFYEQVVRQPWGTTWPDDSQHTWEEELNSAMNDELGPHASEMARDAWQSRRARTYIQNEPRHFLKAVVHRVRSLWNTVPQGDAASGVNPRLISSVGWFYTVVLILGIVGLVRALIGSDRRDWAPLLILIVSVQVVHLFYWTNTRMRAPLTPAIALFAANAIVRSSKSNADMQR